MQPGSLSRVVLFQLILLIIIVPLAYGPIGHYWNLAGGAPDIFLVSLWAFAWLTSRSVSLLWALMLGLAVDLVSFTPFGLWTLVFLALSLLVDFLRARFFKVSSILEALVTLVMANAVMVLVGFAITRTLLLGPILIGLLANVGLGTVLYYLLVMRFRLTERWEGRQL